MSVHYVTLPGAAGNYISTDDVNLLDADSAHLQQSVGQWSVGALSTTHVLFGDNSLKVTGGVDTVLTPGAGTFKSMSVGGEDSLPRGVTFSPDGTKAYIVGIDTNTVYQYTLSTAWDVSTGSYASKSMSVGTEDGNPFGVAFSADGTKAYIVGIATDTVYQYTLTTPWDISTGTYASKSMYVGGEEGNPQDVAFSSDGTKAYVVGHATDTVYQYTLTDGTTPELLAVEAVPDEDGVHHIRMSFG